MTITAKHHGWEPIIDIMNNSYIIKGDKLSGENQEERRSYESSHGCRLQRVKAIFGQKSHGSCVVAMEISGRKRFQGRREGVCSDCAGMFEKESPVAAEVRRERTDTRIP